MACGRYYRGCRICGVDIYTSVFPDLWKFDLEHTHDDEEDRWTTTY